MYTVEFDYDATLVTSMDESDKFEDVELVLGADGVVYIRQFEDALNEHQLIVLSYQQLLDIVTSLQQTEGMFQLQFNKIVR